MILWFNSGHTEREREREREGGGGSEIEQKLKCDVNFAFSSLPNDMQAAERQARLERELNLKCMYMSEESVRSVPTSCLDPLESKLGFSHKSTFGQSAERAA